MLHICCNTAKDQSMLSLHLQTLLSRLYCPDVNQQWKDGELLLNLDHCKDIQCDYTDTLKGDELLM